MFFIRFLKYDNDYFLYTNLYLFSNKYIDILKCNNVVVAFTQNIIE